MTGVRQVHRGQCYLKFKVARPQGFPGCRSPVPGLGRQHIATPGVYRRTVRAGLGTRRGQFLSVGCGQSVHRLWYAL